jgi:DNA-binding transcriptional LysR family regulator
MRRRARPPGRSVVDIQHMKYFISVAQLLNFTKAAEEQHIAQPSMSQIISAMEKELGAKLFVRNNRSVRLTPAGQAFFDEAKLVVARYEEAVKKTALAASGAEGTLRVGYWGPYEQILIPKLLAKFHRTYPNIELSIKQDDNKVLIHDLENEVIDVVFSSPYPFQGREDFSCILLDSSEECAVVYRSHPLALLNKITPRELNSEKFVLLDMQDAQDALKLQRDCLRNGFTPNIISRQTQYGNLLMMVESEIGITLLPRCLEPYTTPELHFIAMEGDMSVDMCVSWLRNRKNQSIQMLLNIIEEERKTAP